MQLGINRMSNYMHYNTGYVINGFKQCKHLVMNTCGIKDTMHIYNTLAK